MIKFVCSSCGERLSVPDQHAGRKGVCPSCHAINRIPLKGMEPASPAEPAVPNIAQTSTAPSPQRGAANAPAPQARTVQPPVESRRTVAAEPASFAPAPTLPEPPPDRPFVIAPETPASRHLANVDEPTLIPPEPIKPRPEEFFTDPADLVELRKERRLPRKLKMALLIIAALGIVAALYFGLLFALHAMIPQG